MTIIRELPAEFLLAKGMHETPEAGMCLLEAAAYLSGEAHTDHPECVSPVLAAFGRNLNDVLPIAKRQTLLSFAPRLICTAGQPEADQTRGLMAADWFIRVYMPAWLRLAHLDHEAAALESLPRQATWDDVERAIPALQQAKAAAGDAARAAAGAAAGAAARDAARDAAWDAAWAAARAAAGAAARAAAWAAAWAAARAAAGDAAGARLAPTVAALQDSAIVLFDRMIDAA